MAARLARRGAGAAAARRGTAGAARKGQGEGGGCSARSDPAAAGGEAGLHYDPGFLGAAERAELIEWLAGIHPLWEERFTERAALAAGGQRRLLRPVYWLGAWQFACLDYYRPPRAVLDRAVAAEPYSPLLARLVRRMEAAARKLYSGPDLPAGWQLNTCLVNLYGAQQREGRRVDSARLGEHYDAEPGPVASLSLGERALFQFVRRGGRESPARVLHQRWLEDGSLLLFGGEPWKTRALHRVLRVERRGGARFELRPAEFETRRVNFTFRYVPPEHIVAYAALGAQARADVAHYVAELARGSPFFAAALRAAAAADTPAAR